MARARAVAETHAAAPATREPRAAAQTLRGGARAWEHAGAAAAWDPHSPTPVFSTAPFCSLLRFGGRLVMGCCSRFNPPGCSMTERSAAAPYGKGSKSAPFVDRQPGVAMLVM